MNRRDWETLIQCHLDGLTSSEEAADLSNQLESDQETRSLYLHLARIHAELATDEGEETLDVDSSDYRLLELLSRLESVHQRRRQRRIMMAVGIVAAAMLLIAGVYVLSKPGDRQIATIVSVDGALRWTGDEGQVHDDLEAGHPLTGGTLELLSVDSWVGLQFLDGSSVTLSGLSVLTISDTGQKELHLREGSLSAAVEKQSPGQPMLVVTPAARLEVKGTQFDVAADRSQTDITVTEGLVRATRVSDTKPVDIPAGHRAVASIETGQAMVVSQIARATHTWTANLADEVAHGRWESATLTFRRQLRQAIDNGEITEAEARERFFQQFGSFRVNDSIVRAVPMRLGRDGTVAYIVVFDISPRRSGPIVLAEGGRFRVHVQVEQPSDVKFGFSAADPTSDAKYVKGFAVARVEDSLEIELPLDAFHLIGYKSLQTGSSAAGRELANFFCIASSRETGLSIKHVELLAPEEKGNTK